MKLRILILSVFLFFTAPVLLIVQLFFRYVSFCQKVAIEVLDDVYRID
jgi:hypothetical protein